MKTHLIITLAALCAGGCTMKMPWQKGGGGAPAGLRDADAKFEAGLYQEAAALYGKAYEGAQDAPLKWAALYRLCESKAHLFQYGEAAQLIVDTKLPDEMPHRARLLLLKADLLRSFLLQYSSVQAKESVRGGGKKDLFAMTRAEVEGMADAAYRELWEAREKLLGVPMKGEGYFFDVAGADFGGWPTLYDYLVLRWTTHLVKKSAKGEPPAGEPVIAASFARPVQPGDPPGLLAAALMEEAATIRPDGRREATERWKVARLLLPLRHPGSFALKDEAAARAAALPLLLAWTDGFTAKTAAAEAGYEAALLLARDERLVEAVALCRKVEDRCSGAYHAHLAMQSRTAIEEPALELRTTTALPPAAGSLALRTRNVKSLNLRAWPVEPKKLIDAYAKLKYGYTFYGWSGLLGTPRADWLEEFLPSHAPAKSWSVAVADKGDYRQVTTVASPPPLGAGAWLVAASPGSSFRKGDAPVAAAFLNVTGLVLVGSAGTTAKTRDAYYDFVGGGKERSVKDDPYRFYLLDARTGEGVKGGSLDVFVQRSGSQESRTLATDGGGRASIGLDVTVEPAAGGTRYWYGMNSWNADPLAERDGSLAWWVSGKHETWSPPVPLVVQVELDRPIYRPGHKVMGKVLALRRTAAGFAAAGQKGSWHITASDANGKEFFAYDPKPGELGSASFGFTVPAGRLLGSWRVEATYAEGRFTGKTAKSFRVEEYKRPEFEMKLDPADKPWKYGEKVEVKGSAKYYFGGPVPDAPVKYTVTRRVHVPWFFRWWYMGDVPAAQDEVASGETRTDAAGAFTISFTPTPPKKQPHEGKVPDIAEFTVAVEGRDAGGRTIEASGAYKASRSALFVVLTPARGFFRAGEAGRVESKLLTVNEAPAAGKGSWELFRLAPWKAVPIEELGVKESDRPWHAGGGWGAWGEAPALDVQLAGAPSGPRVLAGEAAHGADGVASIALEGLAAGTYRLVEKVPDGWGGEARQERIVVVAGGAQEAVPVDAASVTLVEKEEYAAGETARLVVGSALGSGVFHVEVWAGGHFVRAETLAGGRLVGPLEVPVTGAMKGGFTVRWFGVKEMRFSHGSATIAVPWSEKKLGVALDPFTKELEPGQEAEWGLSLTDGEGKPARGEALVMVYDRSLEYYVKGGGGWLEWLYAPSGGPSMGAGSVYPRYAVLLPAEESIFEKIMKKLGKEPEPPKPPGLRTWDTWAGLPGGFRSMARSKGEEGMLGAPPPAPMAAAPARGAMEETEAADFMASEAQDERAKDKGPAGGKGQQGPAARAEFLDTALFLPAVATSQDGKATIAFTAPGQLTGWKVKVMAFTKDVKEGSLALEAVTRKELMVRLDLPRFYREKDLGTIQAVVHNETDAPLEGEVLIDVREGEADAAGRLGIVEKKRHFAAPARGLATIDWTIAVPDGAAVLKVKAAAVAGKLADAEERELPILPSRQRLVESVFVALTGKEKKKLELRAEPDPTRVNEQMVLQVDPQLALSILNSIPSLVEYPYECVEQTLNKYVPLAIVGEIYRKYPDLKKASAKVPKRDTIAPAWEKDDPRRLTALMETPWVTQSEGGKTAWPLVDLLDPARVAQEGQESLAKLRAAQHPSGGFPWWPGGRENLYMTLYVLEGFATAMEHGVEAPADVVERALGYVNGEITRVIKDEEQYLSLAVYAAWVVTSFPPEKFDGAKKGFAAAKGWVDFALTRTKAMTPFGKAYLAWASARLGDTKTSDGLIDMIMDGTKEDPVSGVFWAPEKRSWVWYNDSLEKHAFVIRLLTALRPGEKRIPGMVRWLLFNRKGNAWKSTKASAAAVYALLAFMEKSGALTTSETFDIGWGGLETKVVVKPDDWLASPLRWVETGAQVTPDKLVAVVDKTGPGIAFASMTWTYSTDALPGPSEPGMLALDRAFFTRVKEGDGHALVPLAPGGEVKVGDEVEVRLTFTTRAQFEYMHLKDPKGAGFEAEALLSGWKYAPLWYYEEPRDSLTNFFIDWLPHGEYVLSYRLRPTKAGTMRIGAALLQSMYAPEMTAHSAGFVLNVKP